MNSEDPIDYARNKVTQELNDPLLKDADKLSMLNHELKEVTALLNYLRDKRKQYGGKNNEDMSPVSAESLIKDTRNRQIGLIGKIRKLQKTIDLQKLDIQGMNDDIDDRLGRSMSQEREIEYKKNLILTRNRMLELSQEKNVYKKKIIYTLLSIFIFILIVLITSYMTTTK